MHLRIRQNGRTWQVLSLLICLVATPLSFASGGDDWVLVERFQAQLKQAKNGNAMAMYEVGRMYERGRGTTANVDQAVDWFERAAQKNQENALARLGLMYLEGNGVKQDFKKAYRYLQDAANAGASVAQYFLGLMYEQGTGIRTNTKLAKQWYSKAAGGGYYQAKKRLAALSKTTSRPLLPQPSVKETPVAKPKKKKQVKLNLVGGLIETIFTGKWERNGSPVGFLPSKNTRCKKLKNNRIKCLSGRQSRDTGDNTIIYVTTTVISDFSTSDEFNIAYYNEVIGIQNKNQQDSEEEEDFAADGAHNNALGIQLGRQKKTHQLECALENAKKLVCLKNRARTVAFTNQGKK